MKKIAIIIIVVIVLSTTAGCIYDGRHPELYQMTRFNVLASNGVGESERVVTEVIEEDSYGRILYSYTMSVEGSYYGYERIWIVGICQKSDRKLTYYYEDKCFIIGDTLDSISEKDIDNLKLNNDWDKQINEERLSSRLIYPDYSDYNGLIAKDIFSLEVGIEEGAKLSCEFVDYDGADKMLYYTIEFDADYNDDIEVTTRYYLMILNEDGSYDKDIFIVEVQDLYNYQELMHEFKIENDWSFS